jgi:RPA family protein
VQASPDLIIAPLRLALKRPTLVGTAMTEKQIAEREITVMADKTIPYEILKKVMST